MFDKNLIFSAIFAAGGTSFLAAAAEYSRSADLPQVLWLLGCSLAAFALCLQPSALFEKVWLQGGKFELPKARGFASLLNVLSLVFLFLSALVWLVMP